MRVEVELYSAFLDQCRAGYLDDEMYNFISGFPTEHCGSWMPLTGNGNSSNAGFASCRNPTCMNLYKTWRHMFEEGHNWQTMVSMECAECKSERERRNRLLVEKDPRLHNEPFLTAPYVHKNHDPKCHAMLLRIVETTKHADAKPKHIMWITAEDSFKDPGGIAKDEDKRQQQRALATIQRPGN